MRVTITTIIILYSLISSAHGANVKTSPQNCISVNQKKAEVIEAIYNYIRKDSPTYIEKTSLPSRPLVCVFDLKGAPDINFSIDVIPARETKNSKLEFYRIVTEMKYKLPDKLTTSKSREQLLKINNITLDRHLFPQKIYLLNKHVVFSATFHIKEPMPIEIIHSSITLSALIWKGYYKNLQKNFNLPKIESTKKSQAAKTPAKSPKK